MTRSTAAKVKTQSMAAPAMITSTVKMTKTPSTATAEKTPSGEAREVTSSGQVPGGTQYLEVMVAITSTLRMAATSFGEEIVTLKQKNLAMAMTISGSSSLVLAPI